VPPDGVRPGHLGVIATGQVVLGDIAATAVDLSLRGWLEIEGTGGEDGGWLLTPAGPPQDGEDLLEYERVLLEWVTRAGPGMARPCPGQARWYTETWLSLAAVNGRWSQPA
jgi:hypothetical protein